MNLSQSKIKSISYVGECNVFDIEMPTYHNFVANDIISHNSHSLAYAVTAYQSQWLKANYPLQFWTTALNFESEENIPYYIAEIKAINSAFRDVVKVHITSPDINLSTNNFECNTQTNEIVWSLVKIKGIGEAIVQKIINIRDELPNKRFKSLEHFLVNVPKKDANKKTVQNLIISGAFDTIEDIHNKKQRRELLLKYYKLAKHKIDSCDLFNHQFTFKEYFWIFKQKELTGFGELDFESIMYASDLPKTIKSKTIDINEFKKMRVVKTKFGSDGEKHGLCGVVNDIIVFNGKKQGSKHCKIILDINSVLIDVIIWNSNVEYFIDQLGNLTGKLVLVYGNVQTDKSRGKNHIVLNEKGKIFEL